MRHRRLVKEFKIEQKSFILEAEGNEFIKISEQSQFRRFFSLVEWDCAMWIREKSFWM